MAAFQSFHQSNFIHVDKYRSFVTTPRSHFNECSHFQTLQHGPFQSFKEECYFSGHSPVNLVHVQAHYVIASGIAASTASGFLSHPFAQEVSTPTRKTLGPIAAFAGKLSSFDVAAKHEAEIYPDTGCGSRRLCAVRICLP